MIAYADGKGFFELENEITLRDYFAAKIINGMIANGDCYNINQMAKYAYEMADAMMEAKNA